jgi:RimJ/RimL family protein N-acetyltransferase
MGNTIETNRLLLRPFQEEDVDFLYEIQRDPKAMRYTFCARTRNDTKKRMQAYADQSEKIGFAPWTVLIKLKQQIIGWGGLNIDPFEPGWGTEIAYFFHPDFWNQGFATELVRTSLEYGFNHLRLDAIGAFTHQNNVPSIRVLEKCAFKFIGYEPKLDRNHYEICCRNYMVYC